MGQTSHPLSILVLPVPPCFPLVSPLIPEGPKGERHYNTFQRPKHCRPTSLFPKVNVWFKPLRSRYIGFFKHALNKSFKKMGGKKGERGGINNRPNRKKTS